MKYLKLILILICSSLIAETVKIEVDNEKYDIEIPSDYDFLKENYLRAMEAYIGESNDFNSLLDEYEKYKESSEILIKSKTKLLEEKDKLIIQKTETISALEEKIKSEKEVFSLIPSVNYVITEDGKGLGIGISALILDSFFSQIQVQYPLQASFGIGWKF